MNKLLLIILFVFSGQISAYDEEVKTTFIGGSCPGCDLSGASLRGIDLSPKTHDQRWERFVLNEDGTSTTETGIDKVVVTVDLSQANLTEADLTNANLTGVNLIGANLTGANLLHANLTDTDLTDAILCNTTMEDGSLNISGCATGETLISGAWWISEFRTAGIYGGGVEETANQLIGKRIYVDDDGIYLPDAVVCQKTGVIEQDLGDPEFLDDWFGSGGGSFSELGITDSQVVIVETNCWGKSDLLLGDLWIANDSDLTFITIEGQWVLLTKNNSDGVYVGDTKDAKTITYDDGSKYRGDLVNNWPHGYGAATWANGNKYVGEWKLGKMHGFGAMTWVSTGSKFIGEWKDHKSWDGVLYRSSEAAGTYSKGVWCEDCNPTNESSIEENVYRLKTTGHCPGCDLHESYLVNENLRESDLSGANLTEANLYHAVLVGADLTGADLRGVNLYDSFLTKANLSGADLRESDLRYSRFVGIDLTGANLTGAVILESDLAELNLTGRTDLDVRKDQSTLIREAQYCDVDTDCTIIFRHRIHSCLSRGCFKLAINRHFDLTMLRDDLNVRYNSDNMMVCEMVECMYQDWEKNPKDHISCQDHMCVVK